MTGLQVVKVELGVKLEVPVNTLQKHLPAPIDKLGGQIAKEVDKRVSQRELGYYPALDFFADDDEFPQYLLDAVKDVSSLAVDVVADVISDLLVPIFSHVKINNIQCLAYSMPLARPGKANAGEDLAKHYTPNAVKFELIVSIVQKDKPATGFDKYADNTVHRWLSEVFEDVQIFSTRLLDSD